VPGGTFFWTYPDISFNIFTYGNGRTTEQSSQPASIEKLILTADRIELDCLIITTFIMRSRPDTWQGKVLVRETPCTIQFLKNSHQAPTGSKKM
jgi:hypothetical protein